MSIFCSILQKSYDLDVYLPEHTTPSASAYGVQSLTGAYGFGSLQTTNNYINYCCTIHNKLSEKIKNDTNIHYLYNLIVALYFKTNCFQNDVSEFHKIKLTEIKKIQDNIFFSKETKNILFDIFNKSQRTYFAFGKLAHIYKIKKTPVKIQVDLLLNEIDVNKKNVFVFIQNNVKYLFVLNDLINIINSNLSNCSYYFADPLQIKNPYNNIPLSKTILYNLYFFIRSNLFSMPLLFELFFHSNFDLCTFKINNENYIRDIHIKNYVFRSHYSILHSSVLDMLEENYLFMNKISIHEDFPEDTLVNIMRPYLQLYLMSKFLIHGSEKKFQSVSLLKKKLLLFSNYNPRFGKRTMTTEPQQSGKFHLKKKKNYNVVVFNTDCISFYKEHVKILDIQYEYEEEHEEEYEEDEEEKKEDDQEEDDQEEDDQEEDDQ